MSVLSTRKVRHGIAAAATAVALLAIPFGIALPAQAASPELPVAKYVALGDSLAAGQGNGAPLDACGRTGEGYANGIDALPRMNLLRNAGCSGATIGDVATTQLGEINRGTTLVTITAGAGDLGIGAVYAACIPDPNTPACAQAIGAATALLQSGQIGVRLAGLVTAVHERSPRADILVTGYPIPFDPQVPGLATTVNAAVATLNAQLGGAVAQLAPVAPVGYVDVTLAFAGHGAGGPDSWLGQNPADPVSFLHPNAAGYAAYTDAVFAAYLVAVGS